MSRGTAAAAVAFAMVAALAGTSTQAQTAQRALEVYAAGSLRAAFDDLAKAFTREHAIEVRATFGASGLLKNRIVAGASPQVFAPANMEHPEALVAAWRAGSVAAFARNALCLLASPSFSLQGKPLAGRLLDADVKVGTSTPRADPSGDYAFALFDRIEASGAAGFGSAAALKAKALQLTGGPSSPPPPAGKNVYGELVAGGQADVFVTYCTNAVAARREHGQLQVIEVPPTFNVSARYGMALLQPAGADAQAYAQFLLGRQGRAILEAHGFMAP